MPRHSRDASVIDGTRRGVRIADRVAHALITIGGIGTVVAVSTVFVFLVWIVVPLFLPANIGAPRDVTVAPAIADAKGLGIDDYRSLAWTMSAEGVLRSFRLDNGDTIAEQAVFPDNPPTAWTFGVGSREAACGFADGSVRVCATELLHHLPHQGRAAGRVARLAARQADGLQRRPVGQNQTGPIAVANRPRFGGRTSRARGRRGDSLSRLLFASDRSRLCVSQRRRSIVRSLRASATKFDPRSEGNEHRRRGLAF